MYHAVGQVELLLSPSVLCEENFLVRDTISQKFKLTYYRISFAAFCPIAPCIRLDSDHKQIVPIG